MPRGREGGSPLGSPAHVSLVAQLPGAPIAQRRNHLLCYYHPAASTLIDESPPGGARGRDRYGVSTVAGRGGRFAGPFASICFPDVVHFVESALRALAGPVPVNTRPGPVLT